MNVKRTVMLCTVCGALAALISSAATTGTRIRTPAPVRRALPVEVDGAALAEEIARLRERLRPTTPPGQPSRNLFEFVVRTAPRAGPAVEPPLTAAAALPPPLPVAPRLTLIGVAEDESPDGPVRTAIISGEGELFLAKAGDAVTSRYRVAQVRPESVEIRDVNDGSVLRLEFK
jgi:hypothetical protein